MPDAKSTKSEAVKKEDSNGIARCITQDEEAILIRLKEESSKGWSEIAKSFPGRKLATLQVRYYRSVKRRQSQKKSEAQDQKSTADINIKEREKSTACSRSRSKLKREAKAKHWPPREDLHLGSTVSRTSHQPIEEPSTNFTSPAVKVSQSSAKAKKIISSDAQLNHKTFEITSAKKRKSNFSISQHETLHESKKQKSSPNKQPAKITTLPSSEKQKRVLRSQTSREKMTESVVDNYQKPRSEEANGLEAKSGQCLLLMHQRLLRPADRTSSHQSSKWQQKRGKEEI